MKKNQKKKEINSDINHNYNSQGMKTIDSFFNL